MIIHSLFYLYLLRFHSKLRLLNLVAETVNNIVCFFNDV